MYLQTCSALTTKINCMPKVSLIILLHILTSTAIAQEDSLTKTKFVIGLSAPELFHAGVNIDLTKYNQVGFSAGVGPSWGTVWPTLNVEHRLYFGKLVPQTNRRRWFFKQGFTWFTAADDQSALTFTFGADLKSKARNRGWTIDLGAFILFQSENDRENMLGPALRFQYYSYFKKSKK
jgi:hypothetical protein